MIFFSTVRYVARGGLRAGEDPYARNKFNQEASDGLPSNREIPDTRNAMWVYCQTRIEKGQVKNVDLEIRIFVTIFFVSNCHARMFSLPFISFFFFGINFLLFQVPFETMEARPTRNICYHHISQWSSLNIIAYNSQVKCPNYKLKNGFSTMLNVNSKLSFIECHLVTVEFIRLIEMISVFSIVVLKI